MLLYFGLKPSRLNFDFRYTPRPENCIGQVEVGSDWFAWKKISSMRYTCKTLSLLHKSRCLAPEIQESYLLGAETTSLLTFACLWNHKKSRSKRRFRDARISPDNFALWSPFGMVRMQKGVGRRSGRASARDEGGCRSILAGWPVDCCPFPYCALPPPGAPARHGVVLRVVIVRTPSERWILERPREGVLALTNVQPFFRGGLVLSFLLKGCQF